MSCHGTGTPYIKLRPNALCEANTAQMIGYSTGRLNVGNLIQSFSVSLSIKMIVCFPNPSQGTLSSRSKSSTAMLRTTRRSIKKYHVAYNNLDTAVSRSPSTLWGNVIRVGPIVASVCDERHLSEQPPNSSIDVLQCARHTDFDTTLRALRCIYLLSWPLNTSHAKFLA